MGPLGFARLRLSKQSFPIFWFRLAYEPMNDLLFSEPSILHFRGVKGASLKISGPPENRLTDRGSSLGRLLNPC